MSVSPRSCTFISPTAQTRGSVCLCGPILADHHHKIYDHHTYDHPLASYSIIIISMIILYWPIIILLCDHPILAYNFMII